METVAYSKVCQVLVCLGRVGNPFSPFSPLALAIVRRRLRRRCRRRQGNRSSSNAVYLQNLSPFHLAPYLSVFLLYSPTMECYFVLALTNDYLHPYLFIYLHSPIENGAALPAICLGTDKHKFQLRIMKERVQKVDSSKPERATFGEEKKLKCSSLSGKRMSPQLDIWTRSRPWRHRVGPLWLRLERFKSLELLGNRMVK